MSEPNVSAEIEDILTSIRRLVSSDKPAAESQQNVPDADGAEPSRLVLTPALRVDGVAASHKVPFTAPGTAALKARVAELERVVARQSGQRGPDSAEANVDPGRAGASLVRQALTTDDSTEPPAKPRQAIRMDAEADVLAAKTDLLNSAELRDLVADIVRQELQGALGERMTRNLCKLVRREIQHALAEQNLK